MNRRHIIGVRCNTASRCWYGGNYSTGGYIDNAGHFNCGRHNYC